MPKLLKHLAAATLAAGGLSASATGCADNESMLFVRSVLLIEQPECVARADPTATMIGSGVLDIAIRDSYQAALLVGNQMVRRGSPDQLRTETSRVHLRGAIVEVMDAGGGLLAEFSTNGTGFVDPGTGEEPGFGIMFAQLLPPGVASAGENLNVSVRVFGETLGGEEIESSHMSFPISVCEGCLILYPPEADDPAAPGYQCTLPPEEQVGAPCRPGQDSGLDCRSGFCSHPMCDDPSLNPSL